MRRNVEALSFNDGIEKKAVLDELIEIQNQSFVKFSYYPRVKFVKESF